MAGCKLLNPKTGLYGLHVQQVQQTASNQLPIPGSSKDTIFQHFDTETQNMYDEITTFFSNFAVWCNLKRY